MKATLLFTRRIKEELPDRRDCQTILTHELILCLQREHPLMLGAPADPSPHCSLYNPLAH
uniref:Uncharacterized protein n=1 Tax=Cucumis melo TaxID=3656 RepID=A0A9I9E680_CUCME